MSTRAGEFWGGGFWSETPPLSLGLHSFWVPRDIVLPRPESVEEANIKIELPTSKLLGCGKTMS